MDARILPPYDETASPMRREQRVSKPKTQKMHERIPESAGVIAEALNPEDANFRISYHYYRDDLCEMKNLIGNAGRSCLKDLRTIGKSKKGTLASNGIDEIRVRGEGAYKPLLNGLTEDVELREHKILSTARLFYFVKEETFHVVAITNAHIETDKNRR